MEKKIDNTHKSWADLLEELDYDQKLDFIKANKEKWGTIDLIGQTILTSVIRDAPELLQDFIALGVDINKPEGVGNSPLMMAALYRPELVELFIQAGANLDWINLRGKCALSFTLPNNPLAVLPLLKAGANPNIQDNNGNSPLMNLVLKMKSIKSQNHINDYAKSFFENLDRIEVLLEHDNVALYLKNNNDQDVFALLGEEFPKVRQLLIEYEVKNLKKDLKVHEPKKNKFL